MKFYRMYSNTCVEEYAKPGKSLQVLERGCLNSEFQFLDKSPLTVEISEDGGLQFPDFLLYGCIPLVSSRFKEVLDGFGVDYLFYKQIRLVFPPLGIHSVYWLALPPRIQCLDLKKSMIDIEDNEFILPYEKMREAKKIAINEDETGRYHIFKLAGVVNQDIIVTETLKNVLLESCLENLYFNEI